jgi:hypothetical protein
MAFYNPAGTARKYWNNSKEDLQLIILYTANRTDDVKTTKKVFPVD